MLTLNGGQQRKADFVGSDVVMGVATAKAAERVLPLLPQVQRAVEREMEKFFPSLVKHLGVSSDFASQGFPARPWKPLSERYVERKRSTAFFINTGLGPATRANAGQRFERRGLRSSRPSSLQVVNRSLIKSLARLSGTEAFGRPQVTTDFREVTEDPAEATRIVNNLSRALRYGGTLVFVVRLWMKVPPRHMGHIESHLAARRLITQRQAAKLIGKRKYHRPVLLPYMHHFASTAVPRVVKQTLRDALNRGATDRAVARAAVAALVNQQRASARGLRAGQANIDDIARTASVQFRSEIITNRRFR